MKEKDIEIKDNLSMETESKNISTKEFENQLDLLSKKFNFSLNKQNCHSENKSSNEEKNNSKKDTKIFSDKEIKKKKDDPIIFIELNKELKGGKKSFSPLKISQLTRINSINPGDKISIFYSEEKNKNFKNNKSNREKSILEQDVETVNLLVKEKATNIENLSNKIKDSYGYLSERFTDSVDISWQIASNLKFPEKIIKKFLGRKIKAKEERESESEKFLSFGENPMESLKDVQSNLFDSPPSSLNKSGLKNYNNNQKQKKEQNILLQKFIKSLPVINPPDPKIFYYLPKFSLNIINDDNLLIKNNKNNKNNVEEQKETGLKLNSSNSDLTGKELNKTRVSSSKMECDEETEGGKKYEKNGNSKINQVYGETPIKVSQRNFSKSKKKTSNILNNYNNDNDEKNKKEMIGYICNICHLKFSTHQGLGGHISKNHGKKKKTSIRKNGSDHKNSILYLIDLAKKILYEKYILQVPPNQDKNFKSYHEYIQSSKGRFEVDNLTVKYSDEFKQILTELEK